MDDVGFLTDQSGYGIIPEGTADDIIAVRARQPVSRSTFHHDQVALAARLPQVRHVLNLCTDRYRFIVGLAAALQRRQISLMAPSDAPGVLRALAAGYPDVYALTDTAIADLPMPELVCSDDLSPSGPAPDVAQLQGTQQALVLFTSGSTGKPKPMLKSWGALVRSARAAGARLEIDKLRGATVIGTVPHQHSYGLESMILLGLQHGLCIDSGWYLYPSDIRAALERAARPRILITTPVHIGALLAEPEEMPRVDLILSATAPLPKALAVQAEARFGAKLIEIYGCTEAGQIATRRTAQMPDWHVLDGVELHTDAQGTWASGSAVEGLVLLHDQIEPTGASTFRLGERAADLVDVAGKRTSLAYLNHHLLDIPGVRDGVFLMGEPEGPRVTRLMAIVVAPDLAVTAILQALRRRIDPAFLPRPLILVPALPRNALGKLPRAALLELARRGGW